MNDIPLKYSADSMSNAKHAKTLAKAQCTQGIEYFDLSFKAEASTSFEISGKLQLDFVWQRARNTSIEQL